MPGRTDSFRGNRSGQAITEYMMLLMVVLLIYIGVLRVLKKGDLPAKIMGPVQRDFAMAYKYGHPKARGWDEGQPFKHVRIEDAQNFRLYINPR